MRYPFFTFFAILIINNSFSQITISQSDMPGSGDVYIISTTTTVNQDYVTTGTNYYWDFSDLQPASQRIDTFVNSFSTNAAYAIVFFNTIAAPGIEFPNMVPNLSITENYDFFKNNSGDYSKEGMGAKVNGVPMPMEFDNKMLFYSFPLTYGNVDSSTSSYGLTIPSFGHYGQEIKRVNYTDGWGTVETPYGIFDALRVRSEIHMIDTVYYDSFSYGTTFERDEVEYQWLSVGMGIPVLTIIESGMQTTAVFQDSLIASGILSNDNNEIDIYPNPSNGVLYIKGIENAQLCIYDLKGVLIMDSGKVCRRIDVSDLQSGIYNVEMKTAKTVVRKKIIISKL